MNKITFFIALFCSLLFASCERVEITFFQLGEFRVMALVVDQPEVDATQNNTITLTPWISDIDAQGRNISLSIQGCLDPGIAQGQEPACTDENPTTQTIVYADFDTQNLSGSLYTGAMTDATVFIPAGLLADLPEVVQEEGVDYLLVCVFEVGDQIQRAFKRVRLSTSQNPDTNPQIASIEINSQTSISDIPDGAEITYTVDASTPPQDFTQISEDGELIERTEEYLMTWFVYGGFLALSRTEPDLANEFTLDTEFGSQTLLVGVLRDGRAGSNIMVANP